LKTKVGRNRRTRALSIGIKYSMRELIRDVINYCVSNYAVGK